VPHSPLISAAESSTPRCVGPSPSPSGRSPAIAAPDTTILLRSFSQIDAGESFVGENRGNKMPREQGRIINDKKDYDGESACEQQEPITPHKGPFAK
jgi:hypothetical protein